MLSASSHIDRPELEFAALIFIEYSPLHTAEQPRCMPRPIFRPERTAIDLFAMVKSGFETLAVERTALNATVMA